jgi:leucyl-tRNA---protein transferase
VSHRDGLIHFETPAESPIYNVSEMTPLTTYLTPAHDCTYRPGETAQLRYVIVPTIDLSEYHDALNAGWRRFGHSLFRPECPQCQACQSLRIRVNEFLPNRSQRRALKDNADVQLHIAEPAVSDEKLDLYDRFHEAQHARVGWPERGAKDPDDYADGFVINPVATQEWQYRVGNRLVGVGYVDQLPDGLSAIYFFHEPEERQRSLGTMNVMRVIDRARSLALPYVYLGFYVAGCRSLEYKSHFGPHDLLGVDGVWRPGE